MMVKKQKHTDRPMNWRPNAEDRKRMRELQSKYGLPRPTDAIRVALKLALELKESATI